jgi:hypothetical protein
MQNENKANSVQLGQSMAITFLYAVFLYYLWCMENSSAQPSICGIPKAEVE